jgi:hypothetical protein
MEFLRSRARLHATARYWEEEGRRRDLLLREGRLLAEAEDLLLCHESELDPEDIAYVRASITRNNRRGLPKWLAICVVISVPALLMSGYYLAAIWVGSMRAAVRETFLEDCTNFDLIRLSIVSIPWVVVPLWITHRKWQGRPEFETIYLDKLFWAAILVFWVAMMLLVILRSDQIE